MTNTTKTTATLTVDEVLAAILGESKPTAADPTAKRCTNCGKTAVPSNAYFCWFCNGSCA